MKLKTFQLTYSFKWKVLNYISLGLCHLLPRILALRKNSQSYRKKFSISKHGCIGDFNLREIIFELSDF